MLISLTSVWKPLRGPLRDWPLALCDAASIQADDLTPSDVVFDTKVNENMQVHYNAAQKWYYLEDHDPSELLVFRQADSHPAGRLGKFGPVFYLKLSGLPESLIHSLGVPHTSFPNPMASADELPRESIEVRTLVSYGDVD